MTSALRTAPRIDSPERIYHEARAAAGGDQQRRRRAQIRRRHASRHIGAADAGPELPKTLGRRRDAQPSAIAIVAGLACIERARGREEQHVRVPSGHLHHLLPVEAATLDHVRHARCDLVDGRTSSSSSSSSVGVVGGHRFDSARAAAPAAPPCPCSAIRRDGQTEVTARSHGDCRWSRHRPRGEGHEARHAVTAVAPRRADAIGSAAGPRRASKLPHIIQAPTVHGSRARSDGERMVPPRGDRERSLGRKRPRNRSRR